MGVDATARQHIVCTCATQHRKQGERLRVRARACKALSLRVAAMFEEVAVIPN